MRNTNWHSYFAWHPVFVVNGYMFDSVVWLRRVKRRWVEPSSDGWQTFPGYYQYLK